MHQSNFNDTMQCTMERDFAEPWMDQSQNYCDEAFLAEPSVEACAAVAAFFNSADWVQMKHSGKCKILRR